MNIDPLAEISRRNSTYTYALNNPVFFIDPDGMADASHRDYNFDKGLTPTPERPLFSNGYKESLGGDSDSGDIEPNRKANAGEVVFDNSDETAYRGNSDGTWTQATALSGVTVTSNSSSKVVSGEYGPYMGPNISALLSALNDRSSGYIIYGGDMRSDFVGDKVGKNGVLYGVIDSPWAPGADVNTIKFGQNLRDFKAFSDLFSTQLELAGTMSDARNTTRADVKSDSITERALLKILYPTFYVHMKGGLQLRADSVKERDSLLNLSNSSGKYYSAD